MFDLVCFGEPLVGIYPTDSGNPNLCRLAFGGDTSNVALAAARLGLKVAYLTAVGADAYGDRFVDLWTDRGVDTSMVKRDNDRPTGLYVLSFGETQQIHRFAYYRAGSAASAVCFDDLPLDEALETRVLHLSGITQAISRSMLEASFLLMAEAKRRGVQVSYDINYRSALWSADFAGAAAARSIRRYADIVSTNGEELRKLGILRKGASMQELTGDSLRLIALRSGAEGASIFLDGEEAIADPYVVDVVDTVGAGDAFDAGLLVSLVRGRGAKETVQFASAVAALSCTGVGPTENQPTGAQVRSLMENSRSV